jgi:hypothetical protein
MPSAGVFLPLNRRKFTLNALNCPVWVSLEPDNSDTFVSLPHIEVESDSLPVVELDTEAQTVRT